MEEAKMNYVDVETNTLYFGYGGIEVSHLGPILIFKGIKPPQGAGALIWEHGRKIGNWEYTGSQLSLQFNSLDEIREITNHLLYIQVHHGGQFKFKNVTFDFTEYSEESRNVVEYNVNKLTLQLLSVVAC